MSGDLPEYYRFPLIEAAFKGLRRRYFSDLLYEAVDPPSTDSIVSWSEDGKSFIVWDQDKFASDLLPRFGYSKFRCLVLLLNLHGFRKVESEHCEYAHDNFVRGKPELTLEIERKYREKYAPRDVKYKPLTPAQHERREANILAWKASKSLSLKESGKESLP